MFSPATADPHAGPALPAPLPTATVTASVVTEDALAAAYNKGWTAGQDRLMSTDCTAPIPTATPRMNDSLAAERVNGWIDGQRDLADSGACTPGTLAGPDATTTAYTAGWAAGLDDLGDGTAPTVPNVATDGSKPGVVAWTAGWTDGQAVALGDDNRDGIVDEDESGWDCHTMGNRLCGPQSDASTLQR
ncbi:hypothetical protein [Streptomyces sp. CL12-4]|uniref:hypothetical protein n=1 Tax=Streptomyces sp. CL12-4 TaxID=2810306 RepID=UPI001EFADD95|nr:hypothetical protein [Streptomyces sp. CL12-4]MCG8971829.1 hypothetical protein [Streptomyces sp. CL12-4]